MDFRRDLNQQWLFIDLMRSFQENMCCNYCYVKVQMTLTQTISFFEESF